MEILYRNYLVIIGFIEVYVRVATSCVPEIQAPESKSGQACMITAVHLLDMP
jgi:hypothetical protein